MRLHRDLWWLLGSAVAAISAAPLFVQGDAGTTEVRAAAARQIEQLSPAERQQLDENFRRFEKLPPADQARYQEIHAKIQQNPAVADALEAFSNWWPGVSAREQAQLFRQTDVNGRMAVVSQIQDEIDRDRAARVYFGRGWGRGEGRPDSILPRESFYQIMATLEEVAVDSLTIQEELPEIQKLDAASPQRYLKLITALNQRQQTWSTLVPSPSTESRFVEAVTNEKAKDAVKSRISERIPGTHKGFRLRRQLTTMLARELYLEGLKQRFGEDDLQRKLDGLSPDDKAELYSSTGEDARLQLRARAFRDAMTAFNPVHAFFENDLRDGRGRGDGSSRND